MTVRPRIPPLSPPGLRIRSSTPEVIDFRKATGMLSSRRLRIGTGSQGLTVLIQIQLIDILDRRIQGITIPTTTVSLSFVATSITETL